MTLVTSEADLPEDLHAPGLRLFVCSTDAALQRRVVDACDTLTTSLGPVSARTTYYQVLNSLLYSSLQTYN